MQTHREVLNLPPSNPNEESSLSKSPTMKQNPVQTVITFSRRAPHANPQAAATQTLHPIPFVPAKALDLQPHHHLLKRLGLWDFLHLNFDPGFRTDLIAELIANYDPQHRCSYVGGVRVRVSRDDLGRALKLPVKKPNKSNVARELELELGLELEFESKESIGVVEDLVGSWVLSDEEEMSGVPCEVNEWYKDIVEGQFGNVDWAGFIWEMLKGEQLNNCYYASLLQLLIESQCEALFSVEEQGAKEELEEEEEIDVESGIKLCVGQQDVEEGYGVQQNNEDVEGENVERVAVEQENVVKFNIELENGEEHDVEHVEGFDFDEGNVETKIDVGQVSVEKFNIEQETMEDLHVEVESVDKVDIELENVDKVNTEQENVDEKVDFKLGNVEKFNIEQEIMEDLDVELENVDNVDIELESVEEVDFDQENGEKVAGEKVVVDLDDEEIMDTEEYEDEPNHWFLAGKEHIGQPCLGLSNLDGVRDLGCENERKSYMELGEEEDDDHEEEKEDDQEGGIDISMNGFSLAGLSSGRPMPLTEGAHIPFSSGMPLHHHLAMYPPWSSWDLMLPGSSTLSGNGHKREFSHENDNSHHGLNSNKRLRTDDPWHSKMPGDLDTFLEHVQQWMEKAKDIQQWMGKARMMYVAKEQDCVYAKMQQQLLLVELQKKDELIEHLNKARTKEWQKIQTEKKRFEHEICLMQNLLNGYRKAIKETQKAFTEYRARTLQADEPLYRDVPGSGGLVLSAGKLKKLCLKQEEERMKRLTIETKIKGFEAGWTSKFEGHQKTVELVSSRLLDVEKGVTFLNEQLAERRVAETAKPAPDES